MNDRRLQALYAEVLARRDAGGREGCVPADHLIALAERRGGEEDRLATLDHVMACPHCRADFELLRGIEEAGLRERRWLLPTLAAAASLALLAVGGVGLMRMTGGSGVEPATFRGTEDEIRLAAPAAGAVLTGRATLVWHPAGAGLSYRVEVLDAQGVAVRTGVTTDTSYLVPDAPVLVDGQTYRWWVRARLPDGGEAAATPREFTVRRPSPADRQPG